MTKQVVIVRNVIAKTAFTKPRESYNVKVDDERYDVYLLNHTLTDIVQATLKHLKEEVISRESEPIDVVITLPLPMGDVVKAFIKDKFETEPQFNSVVFS